MITARFFALSICLHHSPQRLPPFLLAAEFTQMKTRTSSRLSKCLHIFLLIAALVPLASAQKTPRPDPYADPANDPYNPLRYITSNVLTTIATVLVLAVALMQTWCIRKWGGKWMMVMTIGAYCKSISISCPTFLANNVSLLKSYSFRTWPCLTLRLTL